MLGQLTNFLQDSSADYDPTTRWSIMALNFDTKLGTKSAIKEIVDPYCNKNC